MSLARPFAGITGATYVLLGLLGFAVTGASLETRQLLVFDINVVRNVVHLLIGGSGLAAYAAGCGSSILFARVVGVVLCVVAVAGFLPQAFLGLTPLGGADILLHAATAAAGLYAGFARSEVHVPPA
jgi:Domain of unknown function (DUF4383)